LQSCPTGRLHTQFPQVCCDGRSKGCVYCRGPTIRYCRNVRSSKSTDRIPTSPQLDRDNRNILIRTTSNAKPRGWRGTWRKPEVPTLSPCRSATGAVVQGLERLRLYFGGCFNSRKAAVTRRRMYLLRPTVATCTVSYSFFSLPSTAQASMGT
jgi:hypothetical protein